jgi:DNA-binding transcriptional regulator GbsR (MarR family)
MPTAAIPPETTSPDLMETVTGVFADLAELLGNPRSFGSIYGILFVTEGALTHAEIARQLDLSAGATSQGLAQLEAFGAVVRSRPAGAARDEFSARLELRHLISGFLSRRVIPRLESTAARVHDAMDRLSSMDPGRDASIARDRLERLARWHAKANTLFPLAKKILGGT